jgi:hypothetical protein
VAALSHSVRIKLDRGEQHLNEIPDLILEWGEQESYRTIQQDDPQSDGITHCWRYVASIGGPPLPDHLSTRVGDCLHNFRCVLDHLVWELSVAKSGDPPPRPRRISFPAFDDPTAYSGQGLHAVCDAVRTEIESLQPYHAGNNARNDPLWALCELSNIDKHRAVHTVSHYARQADIQVNTVIPGARVERRPDGPVEHGAVLARLFLPRSLFYAAEVDVNIRVMRGVAIPETDTTPLLHLGQTLEGIKQSVNDIAERLGAFLP